MTVRLTTISCSTGDIALDYEPELADEPVVRIHVPGSPAPDIAWIPVTAFLQAADALRSPTGRLPREPNIQWPKPRR